MRKLLVGTILVFVVSLVLTSLTYAQSKTVVVGWDGSALRIIKEMLEEGDLPNLESVIADGSFSEVFVTGQTSTVPGWAQITTGKDGNDTGAHTNGNYGNIPDGMTIFEQLENHFGDGNIHNIFVSGKSFLSARPQKLFFNARDSLDCFALGRDISNQQVLNEWTSCFDDYLVNHNDEKLFALIHFSSPDEEGHVYNMASIQYRVVLKILDSFLGDILDDVGADAEIFVISDHGFDDKNARFPLNTPQEQGFGHIMAPYTFLGSTIPDLPERLLRLDIFDLMMDSIVE